MTDTLNNSRIVKNTGLLYSRMIITMLISLYTSRIILNTLGVSDFGIYNVVGGVVGAFTVINSSMSAATQRFLAFEIGQGESGNVGRIFSASVIIHFIIALLVILLVETIGIWFLNTKMIIPADRINTANWVFQFSLITCCISIVSIPYNALIISHEKMGVFAYISIIEMALKLIAVFVLDWLPFEKLKLYSILICLISLIVRIIYGVYCSREFKYIKFVFVNEKSIFKAMLSFSGWNLFGSISGMMRVQGVNILLNLFFGPVVNAAQGIAFQVNSAVTGFVTNFQTAMNPQIVKSYSSGNKVYFESLIFRGSKFSYYLLLLISLPVILEAPYILTMWLKQVPDYTVLFCRLILINAMIDSISGPLIGAALSTGRIKFYQITVGGLMICIVPVSYLFLKLGYSPQTVMYVSIFLSFVALFTRLYMLSRMIELPVVKYLKDVFIKIIVVTVLTIISTWLLQCSLESGIYRLLIVCFVSVFSGSVFIYYWGMTNGEQRFILDKVKNLIHWER